MTNPTPKQPDWRESLKSKSPSWITLFRAKDEALPIVLKDIEDFIQSVAERSSEKSWNECLAQIDKTNEWNIKQVRDTFRKRVVEELEGMKKEMELHYCGEDLCSHYPRTESWNFALSDAQQKVREI